MQRHPSTDLKGNCSAELIQHVLVNSGPGGSGATISVCFRVTSIPAGLLRARTTPMLHGTAAAWEIFLDLTYFCTAFTRCPETPSQSIRPAFDQYALEDVTLCWKGQRSFRLLAGGSDLCRRQWCPPQLWVALKTHCWRFCRPLALSSFHTCTSYCWRVLFNTLPQTAVCTFFFFNK